MKITDEAVEAAAKALYEGESHLNRWDWPIVEVDREEYRAQARLALEAAAPHMLAEAWGVARILVESRIEGDDPEGDLAWAISKYRERGAK